MTDDAATETPVTDIAPEACPGFVLAVADDCPVLGADAIGRFRSYSVANGVLTLKW